MVFRSSVTLERVVYYIELLTDEDKIKLLKIIQDSMMNKSILNDSAVAISSSYLWKITEK